MNNSRKVFIETSVFIRFFTKDNREKFNDCRQFFELIEDGKLRPYTSNIVVLEVIFVLGKVYKFPLEKVLNAVESLLELRNITLVERTDTKEALTLFKRYKIKYADCLIATQIPNDTSLITYDTDFQKLKTLVAQPPNQYL